MNKITWNEIFTLRICAHTTQRITAIQLTLFKIHVEKIHFIFETYFMYIENIGHMCYE